MTKIKILVIRFSAIGDIIWTTPVVRVLKKQMPDTELHFCTKFQYRELLENNPHIDKFYFLKDSLKALVQELKAEKYDYIIDLHNNVRTAILKFRLRQKSFSYRKYTWQRWLLVMFKINWMPHKHIADWYLETLKPLGIQPDGLGLDYFLNEKYEVPIDTLPKTHQQGYVAFVMGASEFTKKLPPEKMIELCQKINQPIVLVGGKEDVENGDFLKNHFIHHPIVQIYNACGKYGLSQSASLVKNAQVVFGHDTGLTHIAAAFGKKIYAIYGGTLSQYLYPYTPDHVLLENKGLKCRPCSKAGRSDCPKGHFKCMKEIKFDFELKNP
jgi:ADP-heptose:LPS heptosyltransferase